MTWLIAAFVLFSGLSIWASVNNDGFLEADGCTHYMFARFALERPYLLVDIWGRPLVTGMHAVPAYFFGRLGVRLTSLAIALLCAAATYRIAANQQYRWPAAAVMFLFAQPLMFLHSSSELTELPFALVVILAFWAYQKREFFVMTVLVAISPVGRPEGFGFVLLAIFALLCHRKWYWIAILPLPLLIWSWAGWVHARPAGPNGLEIDMPWWQWLIRNWPYEAESNYGRGPIWHYLSFLPVIAGPLLVPFALAGGWMAWREKLFGRDHQSRCQFVITAIPFGILIVHSVFWAFGKFSGGELRYHLVVGPFWALVAAKGYEAIACRLSLRRPMAIAAVLSVLPLGVNLFYKVLPIGLTSEDVAAKRIVEQYLADPELQAKYPRVTTPVAGVYYFLDRCSSDYEKAGVWMRHAIEDPAPGQFLVFETILANFNSDKRMLIPQEVIEQSGWVKTYESKPEFKYGRWCVWAVYLSPQTIDGQATVMP
jgi:hypothetical protein